MAFAYEEQFTGQFLSNRGQPAKKSFCFKRLETQCFLFVS